MHRRLLGLASALLVIGSTLLSQAQWTGIQNPMLRQAVAVGVPSSLGATGGTSSSGTTIALTAAANIQSGDLVVVAVGTAGSATTVTGVSDGINTYSLAIRILGTTTPSYLEIWYKSNAAAVTSPVITATYAGSTSFRLIGAARVTGANGGVDKTASSDTGAAISTGTLTSSNEAIFGSAFGFTANTYSDSAPFTNLFHINDSTANVPFGMGYDVVVNSTGSVTYTPPSPGTISYISAMASFKRG